MAFDPDAYLEESSSEKFDPDKYLESHPGHGPIGKRFKESKPESMPISELLMSPVGGAEMLLRKATAGAASIPAALAYGGAAVGKAFGADVDPSAVQSGVQEYFTYDPLSQSAKQGEARLGSMVQPIIEPIARKYGEATRAVAAESPFAGELMKAAPGAFQAAAALVPAAAAARNSMNQPFVPHGPEPIYSLEPKRVTPTDEINIANPQDIVPTMSPQDLIAQAHLRSAQSMGAASAAPNLQNVSPELQAAVSRTAQKTGGTINPDVLARHVDADSLPVKVPLTPGQALQDPKTISFEMNNRGRIEGLPDLLNSQNRKLIENVQAIRDQVGPDVFTTNQVEHGDALIAAYQSKAAAADALISQKYDALRQANGGQFPVDAKALLSNASAQLHSKLLYDHAPREVMSTLNRLADADNMTFENFESLRTNLARIQRSPTADGNVKAAAGIIRDSMEQLPLAPQAAGLKPLADEARAAARAQFAALESDAAYKAAVNETVTPDRFVHKFIIGGSRDGVAQMRANLADDPVSLQTMSVAAIDHLKRASGIDADWNGNFSQANFNKNLQALSPKIPSLLGPATTEQLETLGRVARYTQFQPRGSFVNNSNTLTGAIAEHAATAGENLLNAKTGIGGTLLRKAVEKRAASKLSQETMVPYGGMDKLNEVSGP